MKAETGLSQVWVLQCREKGIPRLSPCMCVRGGRGWSAQRKEAESKEKAGSLNMDPPQGKSGDSLNGFLVNSLSRR